jgi:DNA-binding YbaB/EbfC family protein
MKLDKIMKQAQQMQSRMAQVQEALSKEMVTGQAGGGMVTVTANGQGDVLSLSIEKEVVNPDDVEMLEDLVLAAVTDAIRKSRDLAQEKMNSATGGLASLGIM